MVVYLDYNATTPLDERVLEVMLPYLRTHYGNPSSLHRQGRLVRGAVERAREQVAALVNAHPSQVVFTSGGTEANNLALKGLCGAHGGPGHLLISAIEHSSALMPARSLADRGWRVEELPVNASGWVSADSVRAAVSPETRLVSVMMANNETGVIQDTCGIAAVVREAGAVFHSDAVPALGKIEVDFTATGVHLMTLSAHKIYGPKGVGALIYDRGLSLEPLLHGSGHESGLRSGTENVAGIAGFGAAAELLHGEWRAHGQALRRLRDYLEQQLLGLTGTVIFGGHAERLPNTVFMAMPAIDGETLKMHLDRAGIAVSSGSACTAGSTEPSHVLTAMGIDAAVALGAIRISLGHGNTRQDIDVLIDALKRQRSALDNDSLLAWG